MALVQLSLEEIWALPEFTIQQHLQHHGYQSQGWVNDRLLLTTLLEKDGSLSSTDLQPTHYVDFIGHYRFDFEPDPEKEYEEDMITQTRFKILRRL